LDDRSQIARSLNSPHLSGEAFALSVRRTKLIPLRQILAAWVGEPSSGDRAIQSGPAVWLACGARGCGKSSFLRTVALELAQVMPPDRLRLIGIDPGGHELAVLESLPHMHLDLATSLSQAESIFEWLAEEAAWRLDHGVRRPAIVLLAEGQAVRAETDGRLGWGRMGEALGQGSRVGLHALLSWEGVPCGPEEDVTPDKRIPVSLALPATSERPARVWDIRLGEKRLRASVPWFGVRDLDAAVRNLRRQYTTAAPQRAWPVGIGTWIGGAR
jgi:hypothetical protein